MSEALTNSLPIFLSVFAAVFSAVAAVIAFLGGRQSRYDAQMKAVLLDATRKSVEADMRAMYESLYRDKERWSEINHLIVDSLRKAPSGEGDSTADLVIEPDRYLRSLGITKDEWRVDQRSVFILTPLSDVERKTSDVMKFACSELGLRAFRGDEENISGPILPSIVRAIVQARLVIANINGRNPNVMYELGIAQALGKEVIVVSKRYGEDPPFDIRQQRLVLYQGYNELADKLRISISQIGLGIRMNS